MPIKFPKQILAGSSPVYEIIESPTRPGNIIIRIVDNHDKQFELPKGTLKILADYLNQIYDEYQNELENR